MADGERRAGDARRVRTGPRRRGRRRQHEVRANYQLRYVDELTELITDNTREELRVGIAAIQEEIDEWKAEFDVESQDELESTLTDDLSSEAVREHNRMLCQRDRYEGNKRLPEHVLELYDDARSLYPGRDNSSVPLS